MKGIVNTITYFKKSSELTFSITIEPEDWNEATKIAIMPCDSAKSGMSATVTPDYEYLDYYKSVDVQGVQCISILDGSVIFKNGANNVLSQAIKINFIAFEDGKSIIVNPAMLNSVDGITVGRAASINYSESGDVLVASGMVEEIELDFPGEQNGKAVTDIGLSAFQGNTRIAKVSFGANILRLSGYAFSGCSKLKEVHIPKNIISIGIGMAANQQQTFSGCTSLRFLTFEIERDSELIIWGWNAGFNNFRNCIFEEIEFPKKVYIYRGAFAVCNNLKKIKFNTGTRFDGYPSFIDCPALTEMVMMDAVPPGLPAGSFDTVTQIYVPFDSIYAYKNATNWYSYQDKIFGFRYYQTYEVLLSSLYYTTTIWYPTKEDLMSDTNGITANGTETAPSAGEWYCRAV